MTAFETFFDASFLKLLDNMPDEKVFSCPTTSIQTASWDRKAAFIIWDLMDRPGYSTSRFLMAPYEGGHKEDAFNI